MVAHNTDAMASSVRQRTRTLDPGSGNNGNDTAGTTTNKLGKTETKGSSQMSPLAPIVRSLERLGEGLPKVGSVEVK